jgi:hypothetical protein
VGPEGLIGSWLVQVKEMDKKMQSGAWKCSQWYQKLGYVHGVTEGNMKTMLRPTIKDLAIQPRTLKSMCSRKSLKVQKRNVIIIASGDRI